MKSIIAVCVSWLADANDIIALFAVEALTAAVASLRLCHPCRAFHRSSSAVVVTAA